MKKKRKALSIFTSLVYPDAPASLTASTRSVTFGSIFQFFHLSILHFPSFIIAVVHSIGNDDVIHEMQAHGFTSFID